MIANVLPMMETPTNFVLSHFPAFTEASACATFLLKAVIRAIPCSAAAIVLAVGALTTKHPDCMTPEFQAGTWNLDNESSALLKKNMRLQMQV